MSNNEDRSIEDILAAKDKVATAQEILRAVLEVLEPDSGSLLIAYRTPNETKVIVMGDGESVAHMAYCLDQSLQRWAGYAEERPKAH